MFSKISLGPKDIATFLGTLLLITNRDAPYVINRGCKKPRTAIEGWDKRLVMNKYRVE